MEHKLKYVKRNLLLYRIVTYCNLLFTDTTCSKQTVTQYWILAVCILNYVCIHMFIYVYVFCFNGS